MDGLASTSSLATVNLSLFSPAISSRTGATILHGPHQVAQKSTTTVLLLLSTSDSNEFSVTSTVLAPIRAPFRKSCGSHAVFELAAAISRRFRPARRPPDARPTSARQRLRPNNPTPRR